MRHAHLGSLADSLQLDRAKIILHLSATGFQVALPQRPISFAENPWFKLSEAYFGAEIRIAETNTMGQNENLDNTICPFLAS